MTGETLPQSFYLRDTAEIARSLLGCVLTRESPEGTASGIIVETEAYVGRYDAACHSFGMECAKPGHRTEAMFREGGTAYVYLIYGMYCCFNAVTAAEGRAEAVLVRALEPVEGAALMASRRRTDGVRKLCSGPGKLCQALGITREDNCASLTEGHLRILNGEPIPDSRVEATPRINVDYAGADALLPLRFIVRDSDFLSVKPRSRTPSRVSRPAFRFSE